MTIFGWDASDYDYARGPMDLESACAAGIDFFTHKATEGTSIRHTYYGEMMRRARDAGVPFLGAYHVVRSPANAAAEVAYCLAYANAQTPWWIDFPGWFWQIDLEKWPYDSVPASEGEAFADIIEQRTGRRALIYASKGQYGSELTGTSHPLWNANYGANAALEFRALYQQRGGDTGPGWMSYSGTTPAIWQYGSNAVIGRQHTCDANAYRGTVADFGRMIGLEDDMEQSDPLVKPWGPSNSVGNAFAVVMESREVLVRDINATGYHAVEPNSLAGRVLDIQSTVKAIDAGQVSQDAVNAAVKLALTDPAVIGPLVKAINDDAARRQAE